MGERGSNFTFHHSDPQKALPWTERHIITYSAWGGSKGATCGRGGDQNRKTFMRQTGYFPRPPTSM